MGHIIPKLNLNKTPQAVDSNSLVFAKNIKVNQDGSLGRDNAIDLIKDLAELGTRPIVGGTQVSEYLGHIVGVNACIYFFIRRTTEQNDVATIEDIIYEYNELTSDFIVIPCNWNWSGGKITGCVTTNNTNQRILTVSEYDCDALVPLKHINLSECKSSDDESIYTQNPNIPITNLHFAGYYSCTIPNGVYQFFVRYKVREGFYTNWFPASKELYAGNADITATIQGPLKYVDISKDCNRSFIFTVQHILPNNKQNYKEFQIGFIISSNNSVVGRSWRSFNLDVHEIYFDYEKEFIEEILVDDLLNISYDIYNSKNVISYKNKLYISNYSESNFNPYLQQYAKKININIVGEYLGTSDEEGVVNKFINNERLHSEQLSIGSYSGIVYNKVGNQYFNDVYLDNRYYNVDFEELIHTNKQFNYITAVITPAVDRMFGSVFNVRNSGIRVYAIYFTDNAYNKHFIFGNDTTLTNINALKSSSYTNFHYLENSGVANASYFESNDNYMYFGSIDEFEIEDALSIAKNNVLGIDPTTLMFLYDIKTNSTHDIFLANNLTVVYVEFIASANKYYSGQQQVPVFNADVNLNVCEHTAVISAKIIETEYKEANNQINTLLPYVNYDFYIHYVKQNGITTNGYYIGTKTSNVFIRDKYRDAPYILYPIFSNILKPDDYIACFFTIHQSKNNIAQIINYNYEEGTGDCIDLDALLYNTFVDLEVLGDGNVGKTDTAKYYGSNTTNPENYFGTAGFIKSDNSTQDAKFIRFDYENNSRNIDNLLKLTPYILLSNTAITYNDYTQINTEGFVCSVCKLNRSIADDMYVSGLDVFEKDFDNNIKELKEIQEVLNLQNIGVSLDYVYSRFNLNCLTIRENLNRGIRTWNRKTETTDSEDGSTTTETLKQQWLVSVNSQNCSFIYDLPLMYKEYIRKYYSVVDDKTFTVFDNTVRSSNVDVDEVFRSIYKFDAEDYYNVPTNRGIIVNLFSINNEIFVHTEHGLFKFTDSSLLKVGDNLYSSNKEVGVSESSPFEIGIAEIVDSQYGHGGLQNKEHALITFNGYIFYDSLVRNIYSYDNQSGIQNITPPVRKIIDWFEPTDVTFVSDDANNRFFITLSKVVNDVKQVICLSYSFISKSFVSIHDIDYTYAFNSRLNTYFIQGSNFLKVNYKDFGSYVNKYPSVLTIRDEASYNENSVGSCIDIIINDGYEVIKYLSHIHWICSSINDYVGENPYNVAEELIAEYGGDSIRVYSDQTWSDLLPINTEQNTQQINSANSYQYPRYNNGIWTMNYFRDIKNSDSSFISDDMALIYGKYIVVRFIFGANKKNFKFENLNINFKNYEKV